MKRYLCLLTAAFSLSSIPPVAGAAVSEQSPGFAHVTTTGFGEVVATPDMATFSVTVVDTTMTAEQAKQSVDDSVDEFLKTLSESGLSKDQVTSTNLYLAPQYHYPKSGKAELVGYRASRKVSVTVTELSQLNHYLDLALQAGINQVDNIQLKVRNPAEYKEKARVAAIKDAREKARSLATGFDKKLGDIWQIHYNQVNDQPVLMRTMAMDSKRNADSYQDSTMVIRDQVDVVYRLK
ncbi:oxidative stress defense protein [Vibrio mytili]|uniref:Oxidative stress defense protein n=1 Tax=Vibrio mytili TaxID=50718 RepID=A0A0C3HWJ8_9VIBR|nr:oxidative stress defense protein [Vibrio mytili]KIN12616.1 hypothetical protein SU60_00435 [Vibrio mytili]